jgi:hypothetical protein
MKKLPTNWLPSNIKVAAIVTHWTGGAYSCSGLDKEHYHFIIDGDCKLHKGLHSIADNRPPLRRGAYAAHTRGFNAHDGGVVIGVSVCAMAGAWSAPFRAGAYPVKPEQMDTLADIVAQICDQYSVPVTPRTVLQHGEVQKNLGIMQLGKWDITRLPYAPDLKPAEVCEEFRAQVRARMNGQKPAPVLLLRLDGQPPVPVFGAQLVNGSWKVEGKFLQQIPALKAKAKPGLFPLRTHLALAGYKVDEVMTGAHQFLRDEVAPRSEVYARRDS